MASNINWGQAFAEVSLIFLGVLLALGTEAWVSSNQDRAQEQEYLNSLRRDFLLTDSTFRDKLQGVADQRQHNRDFLQLLQGEPGSVPVESLSRQVRKVFLWDGFEPVLATYNDLVNSGNLGLIRNNELRIAMAEFSSYMDSSRLLIDWPMQQWTNQVLPLDRKSVV